jgi:hypothetical protein
LTVNDCEIATNQQSVLNHCQRGNPAFDLGIPWFERTVAPVQFGQPLMRNPSQTVEGTTEVDPISLCRQPIDRTIVQRPARFDFLAGRQVEGDDMIGVGSWPLGGGRIRALKDASNVSRISSESNRIHPTGTQNLWRPRLNLTAQRVQCSDSISRNGSTTIAVTANTIEGTHRVQLAAMFTKLVYLITVPAGPNAKRGVFVNCLQV